MPEDRLLHPRLRMSIKVSTLTDLEFRVWIDYLLVADNFGVLPYRAAMLRAGNEAFAARPEAEIKLALDNVVRTGLLLSFEHQGQPYLCDPVWQDFQKIRYPKSTYYPPPPPDLFPKLSGKTRELFREFHPSVTAKLYPVSRPDTRLVANGKRLVVREEGFGEESGFAEFYKTYPRHVARDAAEKAWAAALKRGVAVVEIMAGLKTHLPALRETYRRDPKFVPHPATWLNQGRWKDEDEEPSVAEARTERARDSAQRVAALIDAERA